jgi:Tfp pilus assembly protein PilN
MHINLIYKDEQRSASPVSFWLMMRVAIGAALFLAVFGVVMFMVGYSSIKHQVNALDNEWKYADPKYKAAIQVRKELSERADTLKALQGWRDARIAWGGQLESLGGIVPAVIQLTEIRITHAVLLISNNTPTRVFEAKFSGRASADRSEVNVVEFLNGFKEKPFSQFVESALLPPGAFRQDPVIKSDRIFEIVCKYYPRLIE